MILVDFSSIIHRMIHSSIGSLKLEKKDGKYVTSEFSGLMKYHILQDLFSIKREHSSKFGEIVICLDKSSHGYWRKDVYPGYKSSRRKGRDTSEINYGEVFKEVDTLLEQIKDHLPWRVIAVPKAEADDIILVLSREFNRSEKILIHSPDKDMIQAQKGTENVFQYSSLSKKWIVPENKNNDMEEWIMEHVCLGDASDDVPKVVDHTEFSKNFLDYLKKKGYNIDNPMEFKSSNIPVEEKRSLLTEFDIFKTNRKKESTGVKDVYKDIRFGSATLRKQILKHGSLDKWLDSHPLYRKHYERNHTLVMEDGIPADIWNNIILQFKTAKTDYNDKEFNDYLNENGLKSIIMDLPSVFKIQRELNASDFDW